MLRLDPDALDRLGSELSDGSILVSATNGKTTTSAMLATILRESGHSVVANSAGSNMPWGIVTALLEDDQGLGLFEVDEAWLPGVVDSLGPRAVVLGNLFRDQLDRYGETETIARKWVDMAAGSVATFVVNADDPLVCSVGDAAGGHRINFGIQDPAVALDEPEHARDAKQCRSCGAPLTFDLSFIGHLGHWVCPSCGLSRPSPDIYASDVELDGMKGLTARITAPDGEATLHLPIPGLYNLYNALGAISGAFALGIGLEPAVRALQGLEAVFGRVERFSLAGVEVAILLIKNPVGANEVLRALSSEGDDLNLWIALNDRIADGRDVSWIWDADFERLAGRTGRVVCSGTRAPELALRLKYAGFTPESVTVEADIAESFDRITDEVDGQLFALPTYTALLELKDHLARSKGLENYWERRTPQNGHERS